MKMLKSTKHDINLKKTLNLYVCALSYPKICERYREFFSRCKIHFASKSCVLLYWQRNMFRNMKHETILQRMKVTVASTTVI